LGVARETVFDAGDLPAARHREPERRHERWTSNDFKTRAPTT